MSMVYDPVSREFRPRESRAAKPQPAEGAATGVATLPMPTEEGRKRRTRRWTDLRRHRRRRETLVWFLFVIFAGTLIWVTVWWWGKARGTSMPNQERTPLSRYLHSFPE